MEATKDVLSGFLDRVHAEIDAQEEQRADAIQSEQRIIHVDFLPTEIDEHYHPEVEVVGDLAHTLWMLNERVDALGGLRFDASQQQAVRREMQADLAAHEDDDTEGTIRPQKAIWDVRQVLGSWHW